MFLTFMLSTPGVTLVDASLEQRGGSASTSGHWIGPLNDLPERMESRLVDATAVSSVPQVTATLSLMTGQIFPGNNPNTFGSAFPASALYWPQTGDIYVTGGDSNNVVVLNATTDRVVGSTPVSAIPNGLAYDPASHLLYVLSCYKGEVNVIDPYNLSVVGSIQIPGAGLPTDCGSVYDPNNGDVYVGTEQGGGVVVVINGSSERVVDNVSVGGDPYGISFNAANGTILAAVNTQSEGRIAIINASTNTVSTDIILPGLADAVVSDPSSQEIYATVTPYSSVGGTVVGINETTLKVVSTLTVGIEPEALAYDPLNRMVYVTNGESGNVSIIEGAPDHVSGDIRSGNPTSAPSWATLGPGDQVLIVDSGADLLWVLNGTTNALSETIPLDKYPFGVNYDPEDNEVYAPEYDAGTVDILNATTGDITSSARTGGYFPSSAWVDPANGDLYVTNIASNIVSVINWSTGLPIGSIPAGPEPFGLVGDPSNGDLYVVSLRTNNISVISTITNNVIDTIPDGTEPYSALVVPSSNEIWFMDINNDTISIVNGSSNTIVTTLTIGPAGTNTEGLDNAAFDPANGLVYVSKAYVNAVVVVSASTLRVLGNLSVGDTPNGLAYDSANGLVYVANVGTDNVSVINATSNSVAGSVGVGYNPGMIAVDPSNGVAFVTDGPRSGISFLSGVSSPYSVNFRETGLPSGTPWAVEFGNASSGSSSTEIGFEAENGLYGYQVAAVPGYSASPQDGAIVVNGHDVNQTIVFSNSANSTYYVVNFEESGLPIGASWGVTLAKETAGSMNSTINFAERNGTYNFSVTPPPGYVSVPSVGFVAVAGRAVTQKVYFSELGYTVTFSETGLPSGTSWSVTFNGTTNTAVTSTMSFSVPNGTYPFSVRGVSGYVVKPSGGTLAVRGTSVEEQVTFSPTATGLSWLYLWFWILILVAAMAAAVVALLLRWRKRGRAEGPDGDPGKVSDAWHAHITMDTGERDDSEVKGTAEPPTEVGKAEESPESSR